MSRALHKLLYDHVDQLDEKAARAKTQAEEDRTYLENNEDYLHFTVEGGNYGYDADASTRETAMGLANAIGQFKRSFERMENGPSIYKGEWESGGQLRTFSVYVKLAHSVVEVPPTIYRRHLPKEMRSWVQRALDYKKRQEEARR